MRHLRQLKKRHKDQNKAPTEILWRRSNKTTTKYLLWRNKLNLSELLMLLSLFCLCFHLHLLRKMINLKPPTHATSWTTVLVNITIQRNKWWDETSVRQFFVTITSVVDFQRMYRRHESIENFSISHPRCFRQIY